MLSQWAEGHKEMCHCEGQAIEGTREQMGGSSTFAHRVAGTCPGHSTGGWQSPAWAVWDVRYLENIYGGISAISKVSSKFRLQCTLARSQFLTQMPKIWPPSMLHSMDPISDQKSSESMSRAWKNIFATVYFYLDSLCVHYTYLTSF